MAKGKKRAVAKQLAVAKPSPAARFPACQECGSKSVNQITERNYECASCKLIGAPDWFSSEQEYLPFKVEVDLRLAEKQAMWGQKIIHRAIPVVVLVNWFTAVYFVVFFLLGMLGLFKSAVFQFVFLYSSIAVVALGFGAIMHWGKSRIRI